MNNIQLQNCLRDISPDSRIFWVDFNNTPRGTLESILRLGSPKSRVVCIADNTLEFPTFLREYNSEWLHLSYAKSLGKDAADHALTVNMLLASLQSPPSVVFYLVTRDGFSKECMSHLHDSGRKGCRLGHDFSVELEAFERGEWLLIDPPPCPSDWKKVKKWCRQRFKKSESISLSQLSQKFGQDTRWWRQQLPEIEDALEVEFLKEVNQIVPIRSYPEDSSRREDFEQNWPGSLADFADRYGLSQVSVSRFCLGKECSRVSIAISLWQSDRDDAKK